MKTACFTGHRPDKLGGYNWDAPKNQQIMLELRRVVERLIVEEEVYTFIFGGALGVDQMAFEVVSYLKRKFYPNIRLVLAMPFEKQDANWVKENKDILESQRIRADEVVFVDTVEKYKYNGVPVGVYHPAKMQLRNEYMVNHSNIVIAVWNGSRGGTYNCVEYARRIGKNIIIINPDMIF